MESLVASSNNGVTANRKATEFLQTIDFKSFGKTVFEDHLATVSETGKSIGELTVSVEETVRGDEICYYVHAQSHGVLDDVPMGTSVAAYISRGVVTLEQTQHEYIKIPNKPLDKKTVLVKEENQYVARLTTTEGTTVKEVERKFPISAMKGFVSEGANVILQRIMCLRQEVPEKAKFLALDSSLHLTYQTYEKLPDSTLSIEGNVTSIIGIQREQEPLYSPLMNWHTYFLADGHMADRVTIGSPVRMQLLRIPDSPKEKVIEAEHKEVTRKDLHWEEDMHLHSHFLEKKILFGCRRSSLTITSHTSVINQNYELC